MAATIVVESPFSGETVCEVPQVDLAAAQAIARRAHTAQLEWKKTSIGQRVALIEGFCRAFAAQKDKVAREITLQMGKPLDQAQREVDTLVDRARAMAAMAASSLAPEEIGGKPGFLRRIVREPVGVVLVIAPWNYPLLTAVNWIVPAVLAGNAVLIKHASRTPLCGDHFADAFRTAGAPDGLVSAFQASHATLGELMLAPEISFVAFTGSVPGGHQIYANAARRFIDVGLELGGKDAAYVAADANFDHAVENLVDGAFYNAGQSCCGIKRIYVHASLYPRFLEAASALAERYRMGDPMQAETNLGPLAQAATPAFLQEQVQEALAQGARAVSRSKPRLPAGPGWFFAPTLIADATPSMRMMKEESFGPLVGLASVASDEEAILAMNASDFGLTACVWTEDADRAERMAAELEAGTVFMNRCDYLDPALPWSGVKDTGKGLSLSHLGFQQLTRLKSLHFRLKTSG